MHDVISQHPFSLLSHARLRFKTPRKPRRQHQPEVSLTNTTPTYSLLLGASPYPTISPGSGSFSGSVNWSAGTESANGTYTNYLDLSAAPATNEISWNAGLSLATSGTNASKFTAPNFTAYMVAAASQANADTIGAMNTNSTLNTVLQDAFNYYFGAGTVTIPPPTAQFSGYPPVRGQWERSFQNLFGGPPNLTFTDPPQLSELRERGARLYCAARTANKQQSATHTVTMGSQSVASVNVLGNQIDLLVLEPTVELGSPQRQLGAANDGAQAFEIPLQLGAIIFPIRGLALLSQNGWC